MVTRSQHHNTNWVRLLGLFGAAGVVICSVVIHPFGSVKGETSGGPALQGTLTNANILMIISRSCEDCHAENTHWPWYSYIAPISWVIERDVADGRRRLNLSRWGGYSRERRLAFLEEISVMVPDRSMPPSRYLFMHPQARLSTADIAEISQWAKSEGERLRTLSAVRRSGGSNPLRLSARP